MKKLKMMSVFLTVIVLGLVLTACGKETSKPKDKGQPLTGAYETRSTTNDGTVTLSAELGNCGETMSTSSKCTIFMMMTTITLTLS